MEPGSTVLRCPLDGTVVHSVRAGDLRPLDVIAAEAEAAVRLHLETRHPRRLRLFYVFGWRWLIQGMRA